MPVESVRHYSDIFLMMVMVSSGWCIPEIDFILNGVETIKKAGSGQPLTKWCDIPGMYWLIAHHHNMHSPAKLDKKRSISIIPALLRKPGTIFWDNPGSIDNVCGHVAKCGNSSVVEHNLAKVGVASSSLVSRSILSNEIQLDIQDRFSLFV